MSDAIRVVGMMSGTSMDGIDVAEVVTDGITVHEFGRTAYVPYSEDERQILRRAMGQWDGLHVRAAAKLVTCLHARAFAALDAGAVDLIGFHGQTLAHDPDNRRTLQVGDGVQLARDTGHPVVWDFRRADVALGGQGAPLAPFFHFACAKYIGASEPIAFLNLGGVGNITYVDPRLDDVTDPGAVLAFDTGPANAPLNDFMMARLGQAYDAHGALAATGTPDMDVVQAFLNAPYFRKMPPKSLDRNSFPQIAELVAYMPDADGAATLCAIIAATVATGMEHMPTPVSEVLVCGGGRHNPVIMSMLRAGLGVPVFAVKHHGLNGDMLEAQAFAYLAARVLNKRPTSGPSTTGAPVFIGGGELARP
jgi:anhydro-N-acetylmuramic acid kinase